MFIVRKASKNELNTIEEWLLSANLPANGLEQENAVFMIGELEQLPVTAGGLEIYDDQALLRGLFVLPEYRGQYLGETTARALINLADKRNISNIYTLIDDEHLGYFLAKMRYVPCQRSEVSEACPGSNILSQKPLAKAWRLDLNSFFSCSHCTPVDN